MDNQIWIPAKVAFKIFIKSLFNKWTDLQTIHQEETNDTYFYVNGKYICHMYTGDKK